MKINEIELMDLLEATSPHPYLWEDKVLGNGGVRLMTYGPISIMLLDSTVQLQMPASFAISASLNKIPNSALWAYKLDKYKTFGFAAPSVDAIIAELKGVGLTPRPPQIAPPDEAGSTLRDASA